MTFQNHTANLSACSPFTNTPFLEKHMESIGLWFASFLQKQIFAGVELGI